jgi:hypothetical protein
MERKKEKIIRCYIKREGSLWIGVCLDFCLATQSESPEDAFNKLQSQIDDHIDYINENPQYAKKLLNRPAPLRQYCTYYGIVFSSYLRLIFKKRNNNHGSDRAIEVPMPLAAA